MKMNFVEQLNEYKGILKVKEEDFNKLEKDNIVLKTDLKNLESQEAELIKEIESLGFNPDNLTDEINKETVKVEDIISKLNNLSDTDIESLDQIEEALEGKSEGWDKAW